MTSHPKSPRTTGNEAAREALISNIAHWKSNQESNKLNMSFLSVPNFSSLINLPSLTRGGGGEGIKGRDGGERGGGGAII